MSAFPLLVHPIRNPITDHPSRRLLRTAYDLVVLLSSSTKGSVISSIQLPEGMQPSLTVDELCIAEEVCRNSEVVKRLAAEVGECCFLGSWVIDRGKQLMLEHRYQD